MKNHIRLIRGEIRLAKKAKIFEIKNAEGCAGQRKTNFESPQGAAKERVKLRAL